MLLAEIHGKAVPEARGSEDYLTSAVFGHLRYVTPGPFWDDLLRRARGLPQSDNQEPLLGNLLADQGKLPSSYNRLEVHFWPFHPVHGEPDVLLVFSANDRSSLAFLIEAKLWSKKSGRDDYDQLVRYFRILDDLKTIGIPLPGEKDRYLIYLTPGESLKEVQDSAKLVDNPDRDIPRLFRLQWQEMLEAANAARPGSPEPTCTILADVACFLHELGLEYFKGMSRDDLPLFEPGFGGFYDAGLTGFQGMTREPRLDFFDMQRSLGMKDGFNEHGKKVSSALNAVRQMHADVSRLLIDADRTIGNGKVSLFGNIATRNLMTTVWAPYWMAWFAYRYYAASDGSDPGLVDAISVWFFDNQSRITEPHLLLGQICYERPAEEACKEFDLVRAYLVWSALPPPSKLFSGNRPLDKPSVSWYNAIAVPLYSITSMEDVMNLMKQVRDAQGGKPCSDALS